MGISRAVAVLVCLLLATASAQNPQAAKLFEEGRELAKQEKWAEACDRFQKSLELDPAPGTKLNLGECYEKQGQVRKGWLMFEEAARDFDQLKDSRAKFAHDKARETSAKLSTLVLKVADAKHPGLTIKIGDRGAIPQAEIVERVDPGTIVITVWSSDRKPFETTVNAAAGKTHVVDVPKLAEYRPDPEERVDEAKVETTVIDRRRPRVMLAFVLGGAGVAGLAVSGVLGYMANSQYQEAFDNDDCVKPAGGGAPVCSPEGQTQVKSAYTKADVATGFGIVGGALVITGVVLYLTAPKETSVAVTPTATPSAVGLAVGGRF